MLFFRQSLIVGFISMYKCTFSYLIAIIFVAALVFETGAQTKVQAKLGILLSSENNKITRLKSKDRLKPGDKFRVFVQPLSASHIYVVFTDEKEATLLSSEYKNKEVSKDKLLILPSETEYFEFDNLSANCRIAIICDTEKNPKIEKLFQSKETIDKNSWLAYEDEVAKAAKKDLNDKSDKPFQIAGNVRSANEDFLTKLQLYTGTDKLYKSYEIEIKK